MELVKLLFIVIVFGSVGLGLEVIFTSITSLPSKRTKHFWGYSSLLYFPLYGFLLPIMFLFLSTTIGNYSFIIRGLIYGILIQLGEVIGMYLLRLINGKSPSEENYRKSKWHIAGLTRIDYFPFFFTMGLFFEYLFILLTNYS